MPSANAIWGARTAFNLIVYEGSLFSLILINIYKQIIDVLMKFEELNIEFKNQL